MKVLLHTDIPKLGYLGDVVEVAEGYGRNYLLPQNLAVAPTETNVKAIAEERAKQVEVRRLAREVLVKAAERVSGQEVTLTALANEQGHLFGSVSEEAIAAKLQEGGFEVKMSHVKLAEPIRQLGDVEVTLGFGEGIEARVQLHVERPEEPDDDAERDTDDENE